jgi:SpoVK/Ycf46/Vps4 family AAA+-type ATPase
MVSLVLVRHTLPVSSTEIQQNSLSLTKPYLECVAEEIQRPLISLTSADIGTDPEYVEKELLSWFELARVWSAVLLLDEADVFLERRSASDLVRNNLVAIFLRTLEYYKGILFLTTNRIGTFDEAFLSRIDVPIYFPALSKENRVKIWNTFFTKLEEERQDKVRVSSDVKYYIEEDRDLLSLEWNGREIRSGLLPPCEGLLVSDD